MNGRTAKALRRRYGHKTKAYRDAKVALDKYPAIFAQRPKLAEERAPKRREASPPSWPRTANQRNQSRPLVVVKPYRQTERGARLFTKVPEKVNQQTWGYYPKHFLDGFALLYPAEVA